MFPHFSISFILLLCGPLSLRSARSFVCEPSQTLSFRRGRFQHYNDDVLSSLPSRKSSGPSFVGPPFFEGSCSSRLAAALHHTPEKLDEEEHCQYEEQTKHYHMTILIPAYNERHRIGSTLSTYIDYLRQTPVSDSKESTTSGSVSILVVDDGSSDGTADFIRGKSWLNTTLKDNDVGKNCWIVEEDVICISLPENVGKGAAIEKGMAALRPYQPDTFNEDSNLERSIVLVADADGSGDISCIDNMIQCLDELLLTSAITDTTIQSSLFDQPPALVVGYRQYPEAKSPLRALLSWGFRTCVSLIFIGSSLHIRDTQCGFKLMTTSAGKVLYHQLNLKRWTHDVEVIHRAQVLGVPVGECGVSWTDKDGSKLVTKASDAVFVSLAMLNEIASMRVKYASGLWKVMDHK